MVEGCKPQVVLLAALPRHIWVRSDDRSIATYGLNTMQMAPMLEGNSEIKEQGSVYSDRLWDLCLGTGRRQL